MDEVDFIRRALDDATTLIETKYADRTELSHLEKETSDRLTEADVEIQRLLVQHIDIHYPTDAIVGEESGGRVSRPDGRPLNLLDGEQGLLASNGHVHDQLLDQIRAAEMTPDQ